MGWYVHAGLAALLGILSWILPADEAAASFSRIRGTSAVISGARREATFGELTPPRGRHGP